MGKGVQMQARYANASFHPYLPTYFTCTPPMQKGMQVCKKTPKSPPFSVKLS